MNWQQQYHWETTSYIVTHFQFCIMNKFLKGNLVSKLFSHHPILTTCGTCGIWMCFEHTLKRTYFLLCFYRIRIHTYTQTHTIYVLLTLWYKRRKINVEGFVRYFTLLFHPEISFMFRTNNRSAQKRCGINFQSKYM